MPLSLLLLVSMLACSQPYETTNCHAESLGPVADDDDSLGFSGLDAVAPVDGTDWTVAWDPDIGPAPFEGLAMRAELVPGTVERLRLDGTAPATCQPGDDWLLMDVAFTLRSTDDSFRAELVQQVAGWDADGTLTLYGAGGMPAAVPDSLVDAQGAFTSAHGADDSALRVLLFGQSGDWGIDFEVDLLGDDVAGGGSIARGDLIAD